MKKLGRTLSWMPSRCVGKKAGAQWECSASLESFSGVVSWLDHAVGDTFNVASQLQAKAIELQVRKPHFHFPKVAFTENKPNAT